MKRFALAAVLVAAPCIVSGLQPAPRYVLVSPARAADAPAPPADGAMPPTDVPAPPADAPVPPTDAPTPNAGAAFAPMAYFAEKCARCHGPNGVFYGDNFGKNLNEAQLHEVVRAMAAGPADAPLTGRDLEIQVAYHRALIARAPFVVVVEISGGDGAEWTLKGEATPDSTVSLRAGETRADATLDGSAWTATLPATVAREQIEITAAKGEATTVLKLAESAWSHHQAGN